jgi:hypothetical protein
VGHPAEQVLPRAEAMKRPPPDIASMLAADMAALAGVRAASCMMPVPSLMRLVLAVRNASGVIASEP